MRLAFALFFLLLGWGAHAQQAGNSSQEEAKWLLERLTSVKWPAGSAILNQVTAKLQSGDKQGAAEVATAQAQFLNVTVREMALKMSTRDESVREPLNDFAATFIGVTRDQTDARQLLHGNFIYKGDQAKLTGLNIPDDILRNNNHYAAMSNANVSLKDVLIKVNGQEVATSATTSVPSPDPAGLLTSRAFMGAHALNGTNRRLVEYTFREFMCLPMAGWADTAQFDSRVGRDVDRAPGGDQQRYLTTCKGCHTGMDGFRGAFARWDYKDQGGGNGVIIHTSSGANDNGYTTDRDGTTGVVNKMNRNNVYSGGYVTADDSFMNQTNRPGSINAVRLGWRAPASDSDAALDGRTAGVHAFGRLIAGSTRFSQCMAKHVWDAVCKHDLSEADQEVVFVSLGMAFETGSFNMKKLFETVAIHPKCRLTGGAS